MTKKNWLKFSLYTSAAAILLLICVSPIILPFQREDARQISCASNLISLGAAMRQYAMAHHDYFPDKNGIAGLDILRREKYCSDAKVYLCPSSGLSPAKAGQPFISSYEYQGGLKATSENASQPLMWDKPGNHRYVSNVLFCDGHVEAITIKNGKEISRKIFRRSP